MVGRRELAGAWGPGPQRRTFGGADSSKNAGPVLTSDTQLIERRPTGGRPGPTPFFAERSHDDPSALKRDAVASGNQNALCGVQKV